MATKITMSSSDSEFKSFTSWYTEKLAQFELNGDLAAAEQFNNAYNAKTNANAAAGAILVENEDGSITQTNNVIVPEFEVVYNQWIAQYNVQFAYEEV
jgi:hypothetical protein